MLDSKTKMSHEELKEIKRKIDSDIRNIVDYSVKMKEEISNSSSVNWSPKKPKLLKIHEANLTREQQDDEFKLLKSFGVTKSTSDLDHSTANLTNMKINSSIITQCNDLQKKSQNLKILFANRLEIYDDYKKLVEFK